MISPIDAHNVAEYVVLEAYDVGQRIGALEHGGDVDDFLDACADLEPYVEAVRWLTGHAAGELSDAALDVIRATRAYWQTMLEEEIARGALTGDIEFGHRRQAAFERVLDGIGWA